MRLRTATCALADLRPYERNNKKHPQAQIDTIKASIVRFGFNDPIGVTESGVVVEGHGRLIAASQLGMTEVPVIVLPDDLDEELIDLYRIAHNRIALNSTFDFVKLREEVAQIVQNSSVTLADMGFDDFVAGRLGLLPEAQDIATAGMGQGTPSEVSGLDFQIVWNDPEDRNRFVAFAEAAKATYGGSIGSALVMLLRDARAGFVTPSGIHYNPAATADDAEKLSWDV